MDYKELEQHLGKYSEKGREFFKKYKDTVLSEVKDKITDQAEYDKRFIKPIEQRVELWSSVMDNLGQALYLVETQGSRYEEIMLVRSARILLNSDRFKLIYGKRDTEDEVLSGLDELAKEFSHGLNDRMYHKYLGPPVFDSLKDDVQTLKDDILDKYQVMLEMRKANNSLVKKLELDDLAKDVGETTTKVIGKVTKFWGKFKNNL